MNRLIESETFTVTVREIEGCGGIIWERAGLTFGEMSDRIWSWGNSAIQREVIVSFGPGDRFSVRSAGSELTVADVRAAWVTFREASSAAEELIEKLRLDDLDADLRDRTEARRDAYDDARDPREEG